MHPPLQIHPDGKVDALTDPSSGEGNAVCVWINGEPWAVRAELVEDQSGWRAWSAVEVARRVAGMPELPEAEID